MVKPRNKLIVQKKKGVEEQVRPEIDVIIQPLDRQFRIMHSPIQQYINPIKRIIEITRVPYAKRTHVELPYGRTVGPPHSYYY